MSRRVLIAGGYGLVGSTIARLIRKAGHDVELLLGGRNPEGGRALADELGGARAVRIDTDDVGASLAELGPLDLVVSALKDPGDELSRAAVRAGVAHIGISKTCDQLAPLVFSTLGSRAAAPVVMLGHWQAGVMTVAALHAAARLAKVETIACAALYDPLDPIGPMSASDSEGFFNRALLRADRRWQWVDPAVNARQPLDASGVGFDAMPMGVLDVASLVAATGAPNVRFDLGVGESQGTRNGAAASHEIYVELAGVGADGASSICRVTVSDPLGQAHLTALSVAIVLERLLGLDGQPAAAPGLHSIETLLDPAEAVARFQRAGVQIQTEWA